MNRLDHQAAWNLRLLALVGFAARFGLRADAEDPVVAGYRVRMEDLVQASSVIIASADQAGRELTSDERQTITGNANEVERLQNEVDLRARINTLDDRLRAPQARRTSPTSGDPDPEEDDDSNDARNSRRLPRPQGAAQPTHLQTTHIATAAHRAARAGNGGFRTMGHWAQAVRIASMRPHEADNRLLAAATTYSSEGVGADGGFAVPPDYRNAIADAVMGAEESLMSRCDASPTASNSVTLPHDESTPWGTSGIQVYTRSEAGVMSASKVALKEMTVRLHETYAFVPVTDELVEDAPMLEAHLTTKSSEALQFKVNDYIIAGTGAGQMLGILNSPALVTVSAEGSQTADTVHADNIVKMWARMPGRVRNRAVWLINQDVEPYLLKLGAVVTTAASSAVGGMPIYVPPGGLSASPFATLLGRPIVVTEACSAIGDVGDILFANLSGYFTPYKVGGGRNGMGVRSDVSMHLYFDQGITAFRWTMRIGGQPWLSTPIVRRHGSNTLSHFVALAAR